MQNGVAGRSELTDLVYGSLFGECSWQHFMDRLATTLPNGKSAFHYQDLTSPLAQVGLVSGFGNDEVEQFHNHYAAVNPWIPRTMLVPVGRGMTGESIFPREELARTEFYNDWLKRQTGCETAIGVTILRDSSRTFILSTCTSSTDPAFNHEAAGLYTHLSPHLRRAVDFIRRGEFATGERQTGQSLFDAIGAGLFHVSETGGIRSMNERARRMIEDGAPVRLGTNGRIAITDPRAAETLQFLLSRQGVQVEPYLATLKATDGSAHRLTLVRLTSEPMTEFLNGPTVAIIIEPMTDFSEPRSERLQANYKLTPKEARIAAAIAAGLSLREIADSDGVSYETVRSHVKNIYGKMEVSSQASLVARLLR
ncbi:DNA-binding CsgD family transcriptional regulator [Rhizobium azooxidifex]|uniref:DNA-binding CsgD family transcriptional regulator n=1 Tax=Mycoplana azooxidifex TaxID=1636188 RepID=A0A7W6DDF8_9HYPH|nr:DNA-binding CsgD family transcriptional regulator [Mycoplana azooxidifex]